ncbi:maleylpyruvate isomerase family mycothiol-dependent enzyme [Tomitella biformata]|uniref:maleylpyruvate isomerase family mycothiol-dependent enzyme n=1 Tax=Tomitella biformata TaxID=630403 RepID=UPI00046794BA|nr:maleylpyruvate isomerase family mycothiol-dependent enzyme [Tomitella biformata]
MRFPHEDDLRRERSRFMDTVETLTDDEFAHGRTLCEGWTPRDVLAHLIGIDDTAGYFGLNALTINRGNARAVKTARALSREELTARGQATAENPVAASRACSWLFAGDVAVHHLDVLRGLGRMDNLPENSARLAFREGTVWSWRWGAKLLSHRVVPTTPGGKERGRGRVVRGSTENLALWLAGRESIASELEFS